EGPGVWLPGQVGPRLAGGQVPEANPLTERAGDQPSPVAGERCLEPVVEPAPDRQGGPDPKAGDLPQEQIVSGVEGAGGQRAPGGGERQRPAGADGPDEPRR